METLYMIDMILYPECLSLVRKKGRVYSGLSPSTNYEWEDSMEYCAPFSGMDNDFKDISEEDALALIKKYKK